MSDKSILQQWNDCGPVIEVSLSNDQVKQKFLARRIAYERELRLFLSTGRIREGFITGFDNDGWIQLSVVRTQDSSYEEMYDVLVNSFEVTDVEETGRYLRELTPTSQARVRDYSSALKRQCEKAIRRVTSNKGFEEATA